MADETGAELARQWHALADNAWRLHQQQLRDEVEAGTEIGFTPALSLIGHPPQGDAAAAIAYLGEIIDDLIDGRRRLLAALRRRQTVGDRRERTIAPQSGLLARISSLIDHLDVDGPVAAPDTRGELGDDLKRLEREARFRQETITKLVAKAYDQGATIARLRGALGTMLAQDEASGGWPLARAADLPDYSDDHDDLIVIQEEDDDEEQEDDHAAPA